MTADALTELGVGQLRRVLRAREVSATDVVEAHLARIARLDGGVHAFATVRADDARAAAARAETLIAGGDPPPLAGIPVAIKDLFAVRGVVRGNGSLAFRGDAPAARDATVVRRLREAGAVVLGTTNMHELAFGPTGVNPALGTPANPWGSGRMPGGSSSGSGAAVASRLAAAALGSDTGGSIRIPSSLCGVSGLKPTYGRVSRAGVTPLSWSLDHAGPLARQVEDLALVLGAIAGHDPDDATTARVPVPDYAASLERPLRGLRIGVPRAFALELAEPAVATAFDAALDVLSRDGGTAVDVGLPSLVHANAALGAIILGEAEAALRPRLRDRIADTGIELRVYLALAGLVGARHYLAGQRLRTRLYDEVRDAFRRVDVLALPATPLAAPDVTTLEVTLGGRAVPVSEAVTRLTAPWNLVGLPALAIPCGFDPHGLPLGVQLVGRPFAEADVLAVGHAYQRATDWHRRAPSL